MTDNLPAEQKAVFPPAPVTAAQEATAMLAMIKEVALTPGANIDAIRAMLDMQRELTKDQAERAINEALARLKLPHVKRSGKIPLPSKDGTTRDVAFARWEDIDTAIHLGLGHPMGPLALLDLVGLDTAMHVANVLYEEFKEPSFAPPPMLKRMVTAGRLGRKTGRGFYEYEG